MARMALAFLTAGRFFLGWLRVMAGRGDDGLEADSGTTALAIAVMVDRGVRVSGFLKEGGVGCTSSAMLALDVLMEDVVRREDEGGGGGGDRCGLV